MSKDKLGKPKAKTVVVHLVTEEKQANQRPSKATVKRASNPPQASRAGKRGLTCYVSKDVAKTLGHLATDKDMTQQALLEEAIADLFKKNKIK